MNADIKYFENLKQEIPDLVIREVKINRLHKIYVIFLETLASQDKINEYILKRVTSKKHLGKLINDIPGSNMKLCATLEDTNKYFFSGYTIVIDQDKVYAIETKADISRAVSTNEIETTIRGPKNAFTENYQVTLGQIKRRLKTKHLKTKTLDVGRLSKNTVGILYLDNVAKKENVDDVYSKLKNIDIDILNSVETLNTYINEYKSVFPTAVITERPDRCAEALSEGKIVIICDNSSNALIVPAFIIDFINPFSDKYNIAKNINFTKIIRMLCFFMSAIVPAFYIAIINFNQEAIPSSLIINFATQRDGVPFPAIIECIIMLILCEILRESDLRFPSKYGSATSILGALILGDAAVNAGLVSPIMIIITAFTYISSLIFSEPEIGNALRYYRFFFLLLSATFGLHGLLIGFIFLVINLCDIKSIGYDYTFPVSPFDKSYFKEFFIRSRNKYRSKSLSDNLTKEAK